MFGQTPSAKLQMVTVGDDLYSRAPNPCGPDCWWRHPPYPAEALTS